VATGWGVIGAAGTRPSENPLIPIGDSAANNTSTDGTTSVNSNSNWNSQFDTSFMSNAYLEQEENISLSEKTPRPNRYTLADMYEGEENLLLKGRLSEFESLTMDSGRNSKVSENSHILGGDSAPSARFHAYPLYPQLEKSTLRPSTKDIITQPPQPIQPPRITANLIPKIRSSFSSQTSFQRIHGQQSSSTASTTSSSYNALNYYGGANGGKMTEVEKKRYELQMRVYRARTQMPSHIVLRVFREPSECVEVEEMMRGVELG
jgi:hypothetical protein